MQTQRVHSTARVGAVRVQDKTGRTVPAYRIWDFQYASQADVEALLRHGRTKGVRLS